MVFSKYTYGDIEDNTTAVVPVVFVRIVGRYWIYSEDNAFFVTIMHLVGLFYQYRYVKEQLTVILPTLFDL